MLDEHTEAMIYGLVRKIGFKPCCSTMFLLFFESMVESGIEGEAAQIVFDRFADNLNARMQMERGDDE